MLWRLLTLAVLAAAAPSPPVYAPRVRDSYACKCNSTSKLRAPDGTSMPSELFLSNSPFVVSTWAEAMNPHLPAATFVCTCDTLREDTPPPRSFILHANQTSSTEPDVSECLGVDTLEAVCEGLKDLNLFTCATVWRTGLAGLMADNLQHNALLLEAVHRMCFALAGRCAKTITFTGTPDEDLVTRGET